MALAPKTDATLLKPELLKLTIEGPQGAIERELGPGAHIVGGSLTADIIVVGMATGESFQVTSRGAKGFDLKALADELTLDGVPFLKGQQATGIRNGKIQCGAHVFAFHLPDPPTALGSLSDTASALRNRITGGTDVAAGGVPNLKPTLKTGFKPDFKLQSASAKAAWKRNPQAFAALGFAGLLGLGAMLVPRSLPSSLSRPIVTAPAIAPVTSVGSLGTEVRERLRAADLAHLINVTESGQSVQLTGTVNATENLRLRDVLASFQGRIRPPITLANAVAYGKPEGDTLVAGVVLKPVRAVIAENGEVVPENEMLPSGWRVVKISETAVELTRDGLTQSVAIPKGGARSAR